MSYLTYMTRRGAGVSVYGTASELGPKVKRHHGSILRSDHGAVIGGCPPCDGGCDGDCGGWHWWWDPTGDDIRPDPDYPEDES